LAQRAAGEFWALRAALVPTDDIAAQRLTKAIRELADGRSSSFLVGLVMSAAETWTTPQFRDTSTRILLAAVPRADGEMADALMAAFFQADGGHLPGDESTGQLLTAVSGAPTVLSNRHTSALVDRLKELLQNGYSARAVGEVCRRIVEIAGRSVADIRTALSASADDLIDVAITLQRFPEAKADGTWIFERLLAMNAYPVDKAVVRLDGRVE
jgi:hypothetical protein